MVKLKDKKIIVTSALPYANGSIHLGHLVEYIQTDIFVRFLRLIEKDVIYCCADDTHGTPIELKARDLGIKPEELIAKFSKEHQEDFASFSISFDSYYSTNSEENKYFSDKIFKKLLEKGFIYKKPIKAMYSEKSKRFLPDRFIKGECPKCHAKEQYGDVCEACGATYKPTDLINPYSVTDGSKPILKESEHYFFKLSELSDFLEKWIKENKNFQPEIKNFVLNWIKEGLEDWDISRDGPYFGFKIPGEENKYYYVWLDAPIGYIASLANYLNKDAQKSKIFGTNSVGLKKTEQTWNSSKIIHFIGKDITYFHFLFWPAMLHASGFNLPESIFVHGFLTVNNEKMSKSRGTFFTAKDFLKKYEAEQLRYYYATVLSKKLADINLDFNDFRQKINNDLVGNIANFCYRVISFTNKNFKGQIKDFDNNEEIINNINKKIKKIEDYYNELNFNSVIHEILQISDIGNKYFQKNEPWALIKKDKEKVQKICGLCVNIAKNLSIIAGPILPEFSEGLQEQLNLKNLKWKDLGFDLKNHVIGKERLLVKKIEESEILDLGAKPAKKIGYSVEQEAKDLGVNACFAELYNVRVKNKHEGLEKIKKQLAEKIKSLSQGEINNNSIIKGYRSIYKKIEFRDLPSSIENLIELIKEKRKLPTINTVVDSYNAVSVDKKVVICAHDMDKINGNVRFTKFIGNEVWIPLGSNEAQEIRKNEYGCIDDKQVLSRLDFKQSERTKVDNRTQNVVITFQGNENIRDDYLRNAAEETCKYITRFCGGTYRIIGQKAEESLPLNLKVAEIVDVKEHPDADKLYVLQINLGKEKRQLVAGLKEHYSKDELKNKKIIVVTNLKYAKLRGIESQGMLLAAEDEKGTVGVLTVNKSEAGSSVN
ncbi:MAG: methionine--tRNA ligase, partial [Nanoarchaeota archaeon]